MDEKVIGKMTVKALGCNPRAAASKPDGDTSSVPLCLIYGEANGVKVWEDKRNSQIYSCLVGNFAGVNLQTGDPNYGAQYKSGKLFLPGGIHETVEAAVTGDGSEMRQVEFAMEIHAVKANNPIGYAYQGIPRLRPVAEDPLARIRALVEKQLTLPPAPTAPPQLPAANQPQLTAGQPEPEKEPEPEPEPEVETIAPSEVGTLKMPAPSPAAPAPAPARTAAGGKRR